MGNTSTSKQDGPKGGKGLTAKTPDFKDYIDRMVQPQCEKYLGFKHIPLVFGAIPSSVVFWQEMHFNSFKILIFIMPNTRRQKV